MKAYLSALFLVSTVALADCEKGQAEVIANITEGVKTQFSILCREDVLLYKDPITHPIAIAVASDQSTALCKLKDSEVICKPMHTEDIRKIYIEAFNKNKI